MYIDLIISMLILIGAAAIAIDTRKNTIGGNHNAKKLSFSKK